MEKTGWVEKRQHERLVATLKASYKRLTPVRALELQEHPDYLATPGSGFLGDDGLIAGQTQDVSAGGMALLSQDPFKPGERLLIKLEIPQLPQPLQCLAEVRWISTSEEMKRTLYHAGLKFLAIHKDDVARLNGYLKSRPAHS